MALLGLSALLLMVSVGQARPRKDFTGNEIARAPEKWKARANPLEHDPDALAAGKKLFGLHCAECHGETAEGTRRAPTMRSSLGAIPFWPRNTGLRSRASHLFRLDVQFKSLQQLALLPLQTCTSATALMPRHYGKA